jgi:hypothetical protein
MDQQGREVTMSAVTNASGEFSASVPATSRLWIAASHDDFGLQWTASADGWSGFQQFGPMPGAPVDLVLRRGVGIRGRVLDPSGRPLAGEAVFLVPHYNGSGPAKIEAPTDSGGRFTFGRAVLARFELVPRSLDHWHPRKVGEYLRIAQRPDAWIESARSGSSIEVQVEPYTLVPVSIDVTALRTSSVQVWKRWSANAFEGASLKVDPTGRVQIVMQRGVEYELWVFPGTGKGLNAPWTRGVKRSWIGTPRSPLALTIQ